MSYKYVKRSELSDTDHHNLVFNKAAVSRDQKPPSESFILKRNISLDSSSKSQDVSNGHYYRRFCNDQFHAYPLGSSVDKRYSTDVEMVSRSQRMMQSSQLPLNMYTLNLGTSVDSNNDSHLMSSSSFSKHGSHSSLLYSQKNVLSEQSLEYTDHLSSHHGSQFSEKGNKNVSEAHSDMFLKQKIDVSGKKKYDSNRNCRYSGNDSYLFLPHHPKSCMIIRSTKNQDSLRNQTLKNDFREENMFVKGTYNMFFDQGFDNVSINSRVQSLYNALIPRDESSICYEGPKHSNSNASSSIVAKTLKRYPAVYPALLSRVAEAFRQRIVLGDKLKDGLTYKDAFVGSEAVDVISQIIRTTDRNLALLLGRSLDAQKFIHDVTYDHRLRDSPNEVYQFRELLSSFSDTDTNVQTESSLCDENRSLTSKSLHQARTEDVYDSHISMDDHSVLSCSDLSISKSSRRVLQDDFDDLPNGVFTLLTECYSSTCTRDQLCYSIACPRRLEQQARLNLKSLPVLKRVESHSSLNGLDDSDKEQKLWIQSVPKEVADSLDEREKKRQEVICEVIYTERDFVKDLEYLRDFWIKPLRNGNLIPEHRKEKFILAVFSNAMDVHAVNSRLVEALTKRQQQNDVVYRIGDVFLEFVPRFGPFIRYGANQLHGKYEFEKEKRENPVFAKFVEETERLKESRKLELNGYLTKPTTRLARYPLLLEAVAKNTADDNPDKEDLMKAVKLVKEFLNKVNIESGRAENRFNLMQLNKQLVFKSGESVDLKLSDENRRLIFKGVLKKRNVSNTNTDSSSDIQVFLFDHVLLMVKMTKREQYKVHRKPIPLELLTISHSEDPSERSFAAKKSLLPHGTSKSTPHKNDNSKGYAITFIHLGRKGYMITLFAATSISRKKWTEHIESQQRCLREKSCIFKKHIICEKYFLRGNKVACVVPYDGGRKLIYGTENGVYVSDRKSYSSSKATPVRVLAINGVTQIDVLEEYSILLVLADKTLYSYPMESLDLNDTTLVNKRPKKIVGHANFFKSGLCLGKLLVCVVKSSVLSSTIKVLEPIESAYRGKKQVPFKFLLQGGQDVLKVFKEFCIPTESTSIHFLKHKLCVGSSKGFEVVNLENLETQSLLDPADTSLDFVTRKENIKPIAIYRLNLKFLLCYDEMAFFVDKNGWATKHNWMIIWEGLPNSFALFYPYLLAFEESFIEIRHVETTALVQVILGNNIRKLYDNYRECLYAYTDDDGIDKIASLNFWETLKSQSEVSSVS
ncbi:hypothetical protein PORY_002449 [Pneumocystis oryctolagi]|uniref:Uncharacterized protein n=1 Tax=Pneumocystis oryctolagi TaxID=42067 RepID=A0ACB7C9H0_9ASCO|nr:hypothetical protein PORY_002449 [Pneumocystis oryctolagi]